MGSSTNQAAESVHQGNRPAWNFAVAPYAISNLWNISMALLQDLALDLVEPKNPSPIHWKSPRNWLFQWENHL